MSTSKTVRLAAAKAALAETEARLESLKREVAELEGAPQGSRFAPKRFPRLPEIAGVRLAAAAAGVRYSGRDDVMLAEIAPGSSVAGVFTTSKTRSAPVEWCVERVAALAEAPMKGPLGLVVNSGNSNAFTGDNGRKGVQATAVAAAEALGTEAGAVFIASTGVIGEPLPADRIAGRLGLMARRLDPRAWEAANRAIMTTDAYPKASSGKAQIGGTEVKVAGFAKGAGMIAPDMATMLVFIFTDANIAPKALQSLLSGYTGPTFNSITVDSDTSTSDTLLLFATGKAGGPRIEDPKDARLSGFKRVLKRIMTELAHMVVKDGEGATKFAEIAVTGARSSRAAKRVAMAIANSPLVKTALAGSDPNWGRIVAAVGKSGEEADRDLLQIWFGDIKVAENGWVAPGYRETLGANYFKRDEVEIRIDLGIGRGKATVWTCDMGHDYITCNADYRS